MAHSRVNQNAMFDWIERCLTHGKPLPDDAAIMERFTFTSPEQARTLLSDLADQGRISIKWREGGRAITLGRRPASAFTPAKPDVASVVRRDAEGERVQVHPESVLADPHHVRQAQARNRVAASDDAAIAKTAGKIRAIINRGKAALATIPDPVSPARPLEAAASEGEQPAAEQARVKSAPPIVSPPRPEITGEEPGTTDTTERLQVRTTPAGRADTSEQASDRQVGESPAVSSAPQMQRLPTAPGRKPPAPRKGAIATEATRRQLNLHFPPDAYRRLEFAAQDADQTAPSFARATLLAALDRLDDEPPVKFEPGRKPIITAAVVCAARAAGQPLDIFVTALITRGLAAYQAERPSVRAA